MKQPIKLHFISVQGHIGLIFISRVDAINLIDAIGPVHLVSHYFINVLVTSVSLRSV